MRVEVTVQALEDDGATIVWNYSHVEHIVEELANVDFGAVIRGERSPTKEEMEECEKVRKMNTGKVLNLLLDQMDSARESIKNQAAAGLPVRSGDEAGPRPG